VEGATVDTKAKGPETEASGDAATVGEAFARAVRAHPERTALRVKGGEEELTFGDYGRRVDRFALGLRALGLERGDTFALMLINRIEFHIADAAAMSLGATPFSLYQTLTADQIAYQLDDAGASMVVTEPAFSSRVQEAGDRLANPLQVILLDDGAAVDGAVPFERVQATEGDTSVVERARAAIEPDDLVTLIYTSGTTGPPKGVQITHSNVMSSVRAFDEMIKFPEGARVVSYLPMAHIAERMVGHYLPIALGHTVTCCPNPREVLSYLPEVKPTWFFAVPRIWEKVKAGIEASVEAEPDETRKQAVKWALDVGLQKVRLDCAGEPVPAELEAQHRKADEQVLSKLRARLGLDETEVAVTGAAPTPFAVLEFMHAIGIPLSEVWGLSESTGTGAAHRPDRIKIGTVGECSPSMELKLAEDGEVLLRGPMVMKGYRNMPDKTAEAIDANGWLHTGDIGELDDEGFLRIVDRKKELIITAGGKNISPANLEAKLKAHPLVGTACVIGDQRPYLTALVVLDPDVAPVWAEQHGMKGASLEELAESEELRAEIQESVDALNDEVSKAEGIKKFTILSEDWVPGGEEVTPTMKLKRKPVARKYGAEIEAMYAK
jgi:long-subunit acyl-CoA synthetase (AMP-forming)